MAIARQFADMLFFLFPLVFLVWFVVTAVMSTRKSPRNAENDVPEHLFPSVKREERGEERRMDESLGRVTVRLLDVDAMQSELKQRRSQEAEEDFIVADLKDRVNRWSKKYHQARVELEDCRVNHARLQKRYDELKVSKVCTRCQRLMGRSLYPFALQGKRKKGRELFHG